MQLFISLFMTGCAVGFGYLDYRIIIIMISMLREGAVISLSSLLILSGLSLLFIFIACFVIFFLMIGALTFDIFLKGITGSTEDTDE